ncbi:flagellar hook-length control protein FliK [Psychrobacillus sp. FSL H8-0484]|uniref:flagellar hook-length control protein FliK n=1 Tax=Psychrobacillus sp. FSL H8-0484 TaxID=2921390 RepID=UPI0030FB37DA
MNIAAVVNMGNNIAVQPKAQQTSISGNSQAFGNVFGQILSNQQVQQPATSGLDESLQNLVQDLLSILDANSLEEVESLLGSKELTVNPKELKELLSKLLGEETDPTAELMESNVWDLLAGINEQASKLSDAIVLSLNGQGTATPVEAKQAVELLKIAQLIGNKSDLTLKQDSTLFDLKQLMDNLKENLANEGQNPVVMQTLKPVTQQLLVKHLITQVSNPIANNTVVETKELTNIQGQTTTLVQTKVETVSITLPAEKPAQSEEFMKELQKVMNRVQFGQAGGANRLVIKLYPEQLGTIRIELIQKDGMISTKMLASTALGKELLDSHSNQLRQGLANQNIQVDKLEITQALQDPSRQDRNQSFQDSLKQQQQQQQENQQESNDESDEQSTFQDFLQEMEV